MRRSHRGFPVALPGFSTLMGRWEEPVIPLHSLDTAMCAIWAYLLPCNHCKACREIKWMIRDRALPANSRQISLSVEAPLNSGTLCMVRDGKWATTHDSTLFGQEVCPYFLPRSTLMFDTIVFSLSVPKQQEIHPNSSERTGDSRVSRLNDVLQLPDGPKQG